MLFFTFVWKEDRGSLGKKLFPVFQAKVRCLRCRPPCPEWLDSISLVATPSLSPPLVRLPPNFLILLSLTILSRLQSPLQFLPPFSPHFSFQCFFSHRYAAIEHSANRQDAHRDLLRLTLLAEVVNEWLADKSQIGGLSQRCVLELFSERRRGYLELLPLREVETMSFCTLL